MAVSPRLAGNALTNRCNTGRAGVPANGPMPVPDDLRAVLDTNDG